MNLRIKDIDSQQLHDWISQSPSNCRVIDVRELKEVVNGQIRGAETMPLATLPVRMTELRQDEKIVIVCRSGARSAQACGFLQQFGYDQVYNLYGGMMAWQANNLPYGEI
ncbi:MAG: rhodanese-like domain-containing protein [Thiohalomonadales bacterium]